MKATEMYLQHTNAIDGGAAVAKLPGNFSKLLVGRYAYLSRSKVQSTARDLRSSALKGPRLEALADTPSTLEPDEELFLSLLDVAHPEKTLQLSRAASDEAISLVMDWTCPFVEKTAYVGAVIEREWWELPDGRGGVFQNVALSRATGRYFTPPDVAWHITAATLGPTLDAALSRGGEYAIDAARTTVLDPACGTGIFLACALEVFALYYDHCSAVLDCRSVLGSKEEYLKGVIERQLFGIEISDRVSQIAKTLFASALSEVGMIETHGIRRGDGLELTGLQDKAPALYDTVLLNPPFGRLRFQASDVTLKSRRFNEVRLRQKDVVLQQKAQIASVAAAVRRLERFKTAGGGVLDWQRLFLAQALSKTKPGGRFGAIVPVSLMADRSTVPMRNYLLDSCRLDRVDLFAETAKLFPGVNQPTCVVIGSKESQTQSVDVRGPARGVAELDRSVFTVDRTAFEAISPSTRPILPLTIFDIDILRHLRSLVRIGEHPNIINRRGELDLTLCRDLIGEHGVPLVRGGDVERYRLKSDQERGRSEAVDLNELFSRLKGSEKARDVEIHRIAGRQCAFMERSRRMTFVVVEPCNVLANSCNYLIWRNGSVLDQYALCGILNSSLYEWRFRLASSNNHVNNYEIDDLPVPQEILPKIGELSLEVSRMLSGAEFGASATPKGECEAELDALVFRQFGLTAAQCEYILSSINSPNRAEVMRYLK